MVMVVWWFSGGSVVVEVCVGVVVVLLVVVVVVNTSGRRFPACTHRDHEGTMHITRTCDATSDIEGSPALCGAGAWS